MALDGLYLNCLKQEFQDKLTNGKIDKIYHPSNDELVINIRSRTEGNIKLLLSAKANSPRASLTKATFENPEKPSMLCMLFRKKLGGATIEGFRQDGLDRVLMIDLISTNELGDKEKLTLVVEIMAQHSNVILLGPEGKIIDALKRVDLSKSRERLVLPGIKYELPPAQNKINIKENQIDTVRDRIKDFQKKQLSSAFLSSIQGISPIVARELAHEAIGEDIPVSELSENDYTEIEYPLLALKAEIQKDTHTFTIIKDESGKPFDFSFIDIKQYGNVEKEFFNSPSALLDRYYSRKDQLERTAQKSASLKKTMTIKRDRLVRKLDQQHVELERSVDREKLRIYAELIQANLYALEKGKKSYELENYYTGEVITVPADPALSPAQNSQKYYKDYRKTYTAEKMLKEQIAEGSEELIYIESIIDSLSRAENEQDLKEIQNELIKSGYLKKGNKKKQKKEKPLPPLKYESSEGYTILVGRNNIQNDKLSLKQAKKDDLWLHVKDIPGSHVILESKDGEFSNLAIEEAANIAVVNSKAHQGSNVPVQYTLVKNLKKPNGARPGRVIFNTYNSLNVNPDEIKAEKQRLKNKE